jgi:hypothetical protein
LALCHQSRLMTCIRTPFFGRHSVWGAATNGERKSYREIKAVVLKEFSAREFQVRMKEHMTLHSIPPQACATLTLLSFHIFIDQDRGALAILLQE